MSPDTAKIKNAATRRRTAWWVLAAGVFLALTTVIGVLVWQGQRDAPARRQYARGQALYRQGNVEGALEAWQTARELSPRWPEPYYRLSEALQAAGETDAAAQVLLQLGDAVPQAPHRLCRLAEAYVLAESPVKARDTSFQAVTSEPQCPRAHVVFALARQEAPDIAIEHLQVARKLSPKDPGILLRLARTQAHAHKLDATRETLTALQALQPPDAETHYLWGIVLSDRPSDQRAVREAEGHLQEALRLDPSRWDARLQLGAVYMQQREWTRARPFLEEARRLNPHSPAILYRLGTLYRQLGDARAAAVWAELRNLTQVTARWKRVQEQLARRPDDLALMTDAAELSVQAGADRAAKRLAEAVLEREPGNPRAQQVLRRIGDVPAPAPHE